MSNFPATHKQFADLGKLLSSTLNINVKHISGEIGETFGPGWCHQGSDAFGVTDGNFSTVADAYADLAAHCMDACYVNAARYDKFVTENGRAIILSSIKALSFIHELRVKSEQAYRQPN